jgi:transcriptional regulator with XRE-family HTH domain
MSDFGRELSRLMDARGISVRELARAVPGNPGHVANLRSGKARPSPELAADLDERLGAGGRLAALAQPVKRGGLVVAGDEMAAIELARRAQLSDVGAGTCERIELAVDGLARRLPQHRAGRAAAACPCSPGLRDAAA